MGIRGTVGGVVRTGEVFEAALERKVLASGFGEKEGFRRIHYGG